MSFATTSCFIMTPPNFEVKCTLHFKYYFWGDFVNNNNEREDNFVMPMTVKSINKS